MEKAGKHKGSDENREIWLKIKHDAPDLAEFITASYARFGKLTLKSVKFRTNKQNHILT